MKPKRKARGWVHRFDPAKTKAEAMFRHGVHMDLPEDFVYVEQCDPPASVLPKRRPK